MSTRTASSATAAKTVRTFRLSLTPGSEDSFGVVLVEQYGREDGPTTPVLKASAAQTSRVIDAVIGAVKASGFTTGRLATDRATPIHLDEPAGVRLAITFFASQPVSTHSRIRALVAGINAMSIEETYYWYAKCVGPEAHRARKALRTLLADEKTEH